MEIPLGRRLAQLYLPQAASGRIQPIEGMRGLAALLVFFVHFHAIFGGGDFFQFASTIGRSGVNLMFAISGYLIYGGLFRKPSSYGSFLFHRLKRIYPAFFCVFAGHLALRLAAFPTPGLTGLYVFENLMLLPGLLDIKPLITVTWSLSYQVFFYCAIPLLVGFTGMRRWTPAARCCFFLGLAALYSVLHIRYAGLAVATHPRMLMFIAGILAYEVQSRKIANAAIRRLMPVAALAGVAAYYMIQTNTWMLMHLRTAICSAAVLGIAWFCLLLHSLLFPGPLSAIFRWTPLRFVGNISYSFYLMHGLALHGLRAILPKDVSPWLALAPAMAAALVAASLLFILAEKPFLARPSPGIASARAQHSRTDSTLSR